MCFDAIYFFVNALYLLLWNEATLWGPINLYFSVYIARVALFNWQLWWNGYRWPRFPVVSRVNGSTCIETLSKMVVCFRLYTVNPPTARGRFSLYCVCVRCCVLCKARVAGDRASFFMGRLFLGTLLWKGTPRFLYIWFEKCAPRGREEATLHLLLFPLLDSVMKWHFYSLNILPFFELTYSSSMERTCFFFFDFLLNFRRIDQVFWGIA